MISVNELFGEEKPISEYIKEETEKIDKQIKELKNMTIKERQFTIFKMFYNGLDKYKKVLLLAATKKYPFILTRIYPLMDEANTARIYKMKSIQNREEIRTNIMLHYRELLKKISMLVKELNINNSLELSILFSYLLWNGYLSKEKKYIFQSEGRKNIVGMSFTDIMNGIGVCINHSEMLRDILNYCGYKSAIMENHFDYFTKVNYVMDIKRTIPEDKKNIFNEIAKINKATHAFNIIEEENKIYIYDSTNLLLYNITNLSCANLINGKGKNQIFPYQSYCHCLTDEETSLLDKMFTDESHVSPYTNEDFISTSKVNIEIIKNSQSLLEDFYSEARQDIVSISEETNKIVKKRIK